MKMASSKKAYCPDCGKEIFRTRAEANLALRNMRRRNKTSGSVYQCETCRGFHLTHLTYREGRRRYREGRRRYRGRGPGKVGTKDGTMAGTMHGTIKSLSHKNDEKTGQRDNKNPILSQTLSHAEQTDSQTNNLKMGQWDNENEKKQK